MLSKIWLSDVQILYLPNSLDMKEGEEKKFNNNDDWVIEEIYYGMNIQKPIHFVIAKGKEFSGIDTLEKILKQIEIYDWSSIPNEIKADNVENIGKKLYRNIRSHLKNRIYEWHTPAARALLTDNGISYIKGVFSPALKCRLESHIRSLKRDIHTDHWIVVNALVEASFLKNTIYNFKFVSIDEILEKCKRKKRVNRGLITRKWIQSVLRKHLKSKHIIFHNKCYYIFTEGRRRDRKKTYKFTLIDFIEDLYSFYGIALDKKQLWNTFWKAVKK